MSPQHDQREFLSSATPVYERAQPSNVTALVAGATGTTRGTVKSLTPRQRDVLAVMMQGKCNKAISRILNLAEPTVKNHVTAILKALNATTAPKPWSKLRERRLRRCPTHIRSPAIRPFSAAQLCQCVHSVPKCTGCRCVAIAPRRRNQGPLRPPKRTSR